jgi:hypothetical protein
MLADQMAAAHEMAMRFAADSHEEPARYRNTAFKFPHTSVEAARMATTAARLMGTYQRALLTFGRIRNVRPALTSARPRSGIMGDG